MSLHRTLLVAALVSLTLWSLSPAVSPIGSTGATDAREIAVARAPSRETAVTRAVKKARQAVVNIQSERTARGPVGDELADTQPTQNRTNGMGTGVIIDPRGYIITNHHVVEDVNSIRVRTSDGTSYMARVLSRDRDSDLALMKIEAAKPLQTIPMGTSSDLMLGETVIAIGNAYGYEHTVSAGIISALHRNVSLNQDISYKNLIQTDASINPGNSGGPLLNIEGDLVGVNVAIRAGAQGIGFAIPVDQMVVVATDMMAKQRRSPVAHGLTLRNRVDTTQSPPRFLEVDKVNPVAAKSGVRSGDVVVRVGEVPVCCTIDVERALLEVKPGDVVPIRVRRGDSEQQLELALQTPLASPLAADATWRQLGLKLAPANPQVVQAAGNSLRGGMLVTEVRPAGPGERAGIQHGDILVGLHLWETVSMENVVYVLGHPELSTFYPLKFFLLRSGQVHRGYFQGE